MNQKKTGMAVAAVATVLVLAYGGATWALGNVARTQYESAIAEAQDLLGPRAVLSHEYDRGFWVSKDKLVLQMNPTAVPDADAPPHRPIRLIVESTVRHGPLAGARLAAAVVESRFRLEGLEEVEQKMLSKATSPTLTMVRRLGGAYDLAFALPAGELGDDTQLMRWKTLTAELTVDKSRRDFTGNLAWPEIHTSSLQEAQVEDEGDDSDEGDDAEEPANPSAAPMQTVPPKRVDITLAGIRSDFEMRTDGDLWLLGPGTAKGQIDKLVMTQAVGEEPAQNVADLQDLRYATQLKRTDNTMGWTTTAQTKGMLGALSLDALNLDETVQRIDIGAIKLLQDSMVKAYQIAAAHQANPAATGNADAAEAVAAMQAEAVPLLIAALPSYAMKVSATIQGQPAVLEYGAQVSKSPPADEVKRNGWPLVLLQGGSANASFQIPKALLPVLSTTFGKQEVPADQMDALLGAAAAQNFIKIEGDRISSAVTYAAGQLMLNGKPMQLPGFAMPGN